jgi:hypothetical protein
VRSASSPRDRTLARRRLAATGIVGAVATLAVAAFWFAAGLGNDEGPLADGSGGALEAHPAARPRTRSPRSAREHSGSGTRRDRHAQPARTARLQLLSEPSGASVYRKGEPISLGTTPLTLDLVDPGSYIELVFQLPGHEAASERVRVSDNAVISVTLEPRRDRDLVADPELGDDDPVVEPAPSGERRARTSASRRGRPRRAGPAKKKEIRPGEIVDPFGLK